MTKEEFEQMQIKINKYKEIQDDINDLENDISIMENLFDGFIYKLSNRDDVFLDDEIGEKIYKYSLQVMKDKVRSLKTQQIDL